MRMPNTLPTGLQHLLSRHQHQIDYVDDERDTKDGYWIYLSNGWMFDHDTTVIHEHSISAVREAFKRVHRID
jgi:hypothetical protein